MRVLCAVLALTSSITGSLVASAFPFTTAIGGTSVRINFGATAVDAIMYYAGATQVAAILPTNTPLGDATVTVTYNGRTSSLFRFKVVRSAFGVFTVSQSRLGDAIATCGTPS
ncbi:MAG TPA: hypothetical protein VEX68_02820 [Bryobacteraceae bacterium]|nr:hypothetical protein [Bryobacteraceae bacterium]